MANIHALQDFVTVEISPVCTVSNGNLGETASLAKNDDFNVNLRKEFRPIFRTMAVFGLYYTPRSWHTEDANDGSGNPYAILLQRLYCHVIQILIFFNAVKSTIGLFYVEPRLFAMQITATVWWLLCAINCLVWYYICSTDKLPALFDLWQTHCQSSPKSRCFETALSNAFVRQRKWLFYGAAMSFIVFDTVFPIFARVGPVQELRNDTNFMVEPSFEPYLVWDIVLIVSMFWANGAFVLPPAFLLLCCSLIAKQFSQFTEKFRRCMTNESRFNGCLIALRRQHQYLSKVVLVLDDAFSFYLAVTFGAIIVLACFQTYQLVVEQGFNSFFTVFLGVFWLVIEYIQFALIGTLTAQVHKKVSKSLNKQLHPSDCMLLVINFHSDETLCIQVIYFYGIFRHMKSSTISMISVYLGFKILKS